MLLKSFKSRIFNEELNSFFEISHIRIQKMLHMFQNAILTIIISIYVGGLVNKPFPELVKSRSHSMIILEVSMQIMLVILAIYYIRKITKLIPFIFNYNASYNQYHLSKDGEGLIGATIAFALAFFSTQTKIRDKIGYITENM